MEENTLKYRGADHREAPSSQTAPYMAFFCECFIFFFCPSGFPQLPFMANLSACLKIYIASFKPSAASYIINVFLCPQT